MNMSYKEYCRIKEGGDGSGNFDHEGRPGEVGGSARSRNGHVSDTKSSQDDELDIGSEENSVSDVSRVIDKKLADVDNIMKSKDETFDDQDGSIHKMLRPLAAKVVDAYEFVETDERLAIARKVLKVGAFVLGVTLSFRASSKKISRRDDEPEKTGKTNKVEKLNIVDDTDKFDPSETIYNTKTPSRPSEYNPLKKIEPEVIQVTAKPFPGEEYDKESTNKRSIHNDLMRNESFRVFRDLLYDSSDPYIGSEKHYLDQLDKPKIDVGDSIAKINSIASKSQKELPGSLSKLGSQISKPRNLWKLFTPQRLIVGIVSSYALDYALSYAIENLRKYSKRDPEAFSLWVKDFEDGKFDNIKESTTMPEHEKKVVSYSEYRRLSEHFPVGIQKGGPGSGGFDHEGRPGQVGGSSSDGNNEQDQETHVFTPEDKDEFPEGGDAWSALDAGYQVTLDSYGMIIDIWDEETDKHYDVFGEEIDVYGPEGMYSVAEKQKSAKKPNYLDIAEQKASARREMNAKSVASKAVTAKQPQTPQPNKQSAEASYRNPDKFHQDKYFDPGTKTNPDKFYEDKYAGSEGSQSEDKYFTSDVEKGHTELAYDEYAIKKGAPGSGFHGHSGQRGKRGGSSHALGNPPSPEAQLAQQEGTGKPWKADQEEEDDKFDYKQYKMLKERGFFGHKGNPPEHGGSSPREEGLTRTLGPDEYDTEGKEAPAKGAKVEPEKKPEKEKSTLDKIGAGIKDVLAWPAKGGSSGTEEPKKEEPKTEEERKSPELFPKERSLEEQKEQDQKTLQEIFNEYDEATQRALKAEKQGLGSEVLDALDYRDQIYQTVVDSWDSLAGSFRRLVGLEKPPTMAEFDQIPDSSNYKLMDEPSLLGEKRAFEPYESPPEAQPEFETLPSKPEFSEKEVGETFFPKEPQASKTLTLPPGTPAADPALDAQSIKNLDANLNYERDKARREREERAEEIAAEELEMQHKQNQARAASGQDIVPTKAGSMPSTKTTSPMKAPVSGKPVPASTRTMSPSQQVQMENEAEKNFKSYAQKGGLKVTEQNGQVIVTSPEGMSLDFNSYTEAQEYFKEFEKDLRSQSSTTLKKAANDSEEVEPMPEEEDNGQVSLESLHADAQQKNAMVMAQSNGRVVVMMPEWDPPVSGKQFNSAAEGQKWLNEQYSKKGNQQPVEKGFTPIDQEDALPPPPRKRKTGESPQLTANLDLQESISYAEYRAAR